ncbi:hypothetical protein AU210_016478 [Fusarium oxysporum f. sp. radicis-cucumerinum]|uniref:Uncharacterized protein n=1 Tax=Fusarium oxysporum f. sp. radicis-cucumerinum TaxID=327505 RepID=A0A2H3FPK7_FUSOX|nr:hypothetical protein AU210_016478 [Fusarium oxysporum f. sp. radicis-cucumerinum]
MDSDDQEIPQYLPPPYNSLRGQRGRPGPWHHTSQLTVDQQHFALKYFVENQRICLATLDGQWSPYAEARTRSDPIIIIQFKCCHKLGDCCRVEYELVRNESRRVLVGTWNTTKLKYYRPQPLEYLVAKLTAGDEPSFWQPYASPRYSYYDADLKEIRKPEPLALFQRLELANNDCSRGI